MIAVVNGPNLNLLGAREPGIYGHATWDEAKWGIEKKADELGVKVEFFQSNHEGAMIDYLQGLAGRAAALIINPGALTHYSYALRDAIAALNLPTAEVHISNIFAREDWRSVSVTSPAVTGLISGFGIRGYVIALQALTDRIGDT